MSFFVRFVVRDLCKLKVTVDFLSTSLLPHSVFLFVCLFVFILPTILSLACVAGGIV